MTEQHIFLPYQRWFSPPPPPDPSFRLVARLRWSPKRLAPITRPIPTCLPVRFAILRSPALLLFQLHREHGPVPIQLIRRSPIPRETRPNRLSLECSLAPSRVGFKSLCNVSQHRVEASREVSSCIRAQSAINMPANY